MSSDRPPSPGLSPDDALPPVEPPSAGFIVQLFVVPGAIVLVVVLIWIMFNWLAQKGNDRDAFVRDLSRNTEARWQAAFNLANALREERTARNPTLRTDPELARQLAGILKSEVAAGNLDDKAIMLRIWLSLALGEFTVPDGLPALIEAATKVRDEKEQDVRRAALEGIALLASNVKQPNAAFTDNPQLLEVVLAAATDDSPQVRSIAVTDLAVIGTPPMLDKARLMLDDVYPDVRYNAATRLAQRGDTASVPMLVEMLDPRETAGVDVEKEEKLRATKRASITINALRAAGELARQNPDADLSVLKQSIEALLAGDVTGEARIAATDALRLINDRPSKDRPAKDQQPSAEPTGTAN